MQKNHLMEEVSAELQKFEIKISPAGNSYHHFAKALSEKINYLITNNFSLLISLLYGVDISEKKLKALLSKSKDTASADVIAKMIIERQMQKIESRRSFKNKDDYCDEEKW